MTITFKPQDTSAFTGHNLGPRNGPWDDIQGKVTLGDAVANPTYEAYRDTPWKTWFLRHDQNDEIHLALQMPHSWDPTSEVRFHIHAIPMVDPSVAQNIRIAGSYAWAGFDYETPANTSWTPFTCDTIVSPGDAFKTKFIQCFSTTAPTGLLESSVLLIYLYRDSGTADTYTTNKTEGTTGAANLAILSLDAHFEKNKEGTYTEVPV